MPADYQSAWEAMNSLEQLTAKIISAREILDASRDSLERYDSSKTEALIVAAQDFLEFYLKEFDEKFKVAWNETVVKSKPDGFYWDTDSKGNLIDWLANPHLTEDRMDNFLVHWSTNPSPTNDCMDTSPWLDWQEGFTKPPKKTWKLPVEQILNEKGEDEYYITLPDDLLEQTGWEEKTELVWEDNGDGSYTLKKL